MKASSLDLLEKTLLPPAQARAILQAMDSELAAHDSALATRADLLLLAAKLDLLATKTDLCATKAELHDGLHSLELKIETLRGDMIRELTRVVRWNFAFWVAQLAAIAGILRLLK